MALTFAEQYQALIGAADARRGHLPYRVVTAVFIALGLHILQGWTWVWLWAGLFLAAQAAEGLAMRPLGRGEWREPSRGRFAAIAANLAIQAGIFASLSAPVWRQGGAYGPVIATLLLVGSIFNLIVVSRGSRLAFFAGATPYLAFGVFNMVGDPGMSPTLRILMGAGSALVVANCAAAWRLAEAAVAKDRAALDVEERRRIQAEAETEAKSSFVAMVSHELRTPVSAIMAGAAAMERGAADNASRANAALIIDAGKMMRTLLDDLLDLSKLDAGRMTTEAITFDVRALVNDTVRFWLAESRKKGVRLRLVGAAGLPRWVSGDPTRLRQVLNNLFSNAIKFTDEGSVTLLLWYRPDGAGFTLRDTGSGITPEQMARLFNPFTQSDATITRTHGGTGLGLTISRQLARVMGGELSVESSPGAGAAFTLRLALPIAEAPAIAEAATADSVDQGRLAILAVDDHEINRRAIGLLLEPLGVDLTLAESGEEALAQLAARPFDLVLMDVNMPGLGGCEVTRRLRAGCGPNQQTPVIAVTGSASDDDLSTCLAAGMNARVCKPIDAAELFAAIEAALTTADPIAGAAAA